MNFSGKTAVITGAGQGIGRVTAKAFAAAGAAVVIADIDRDAGEEAEALLRGAGAEAVFIRCDVAREGDVRRLFRKTARLFGRVDALINNAAIMGQGDIFSRSKAEWDRVLAVNLGGAYLCSREAARLMKRRKSGVIINIASTRALMSEPGTEPYSASKGGILALTHSLAVSLGPLGIRVNAVSPGWIEVSEHKKRALAHAPVLSEADHKQHPAQRVGRAEDIAELCLFLASDKAGFITGANIVADGGMTIKMIYV